MLALIRLRRVGYRLAYGALTVWWFFRRPAVEGVKCLLTHRGQVLLVRHTYGPAVWDLPGGGVKRGEAALRAAEREMSEELGIDHADWRPAGTIWGHQNFRLDTIHCFAAELDSPAVTRNRVELAQARWFSRHALPDRVSVYAAGVLSSALE